MWLQYLKGPEKATELILASATFTRKETEKKEI